MAGRGGLPHAPAQALAWQRPSWQQVTLLEDCLKTPPLSTWYLIQQPPLPCCQPASTAACMRAVHPCSAPACPARCCASPCATSLVSRALRIKQTPCTELPGAQRFEEDWKDDS